MRKVWMVAISLLLCMSIALPAFAVNPMPRVMDQADLLTDSEETELLQKLDSISAEQGMDVVVVTTDSLDGKTPTAYADDFYDDNGYSEDGVLLLVSMEDRDWWISTSGYGITAFTDAGLEYVGERILPSLSDGKYAQAFGIYADTCDEFITQSKTGVPYDSHNLSTAGDGTFEVTRSMSSVIIGIAAAVCLFIGQLLFLL